MTKKQAENQAVEEKEVVVEESATATNEGEANANMTEEQAQIGRASCRERVLARV